MPVGADTLAKGMMQWRDHSPGSTQSLPPQYLSDFLRAYVHEAYEHECKEAKYKGGTKPYNTMDEKVRHYGRAVYLELLQDMRYNADLRRAAKKFETTCDDVCAMVAEVCTEDEGPEAMEGIGGEPAMNADPNGFAYSRVPHRPAIDQVQPLALRKSGAVRLADDPPLALDRRLQAAAATQTQYFDPPIQVAQPEEKKFGQVMVNPILGAHLFGKR